jgi:hypothetical protein
MRVILIISLFVLGSCSAEWHLNKAMKKGFKCNEVYDTIQIVSVDSFPVIKNDTIFWERFITKKDTIIKYKTEYVPKTRWQTRIENKFRIDTIKVYLKEKTKQQRIKAKAESKSRINWNMLFIGIFIGFTISFVLRLIKIIYLR